MFDHFAAATLALNPGCLRIVAVDADEKVRWAYPVEPNRHLIGFDVRTHREGYETLTRARETRHAVLSPPLLLVGGAKGFVITAPIFRDEAFAGAVVGSMRVDDFFSALTLKEVTDRYGETVSDSGAVLFANEGAAVAASTIRSTDRLEIAGRVWSVSVAPLPAVVSASIGTGRAALWTLGSVLSLLAGLGAVVATERALAFTSCTYSIMSADREGAEPYPHPQ